MIKLLFKFVLLSFLCLACSYSKAEVEYKNNINELKKLLIDFKKIPLPQEDVTLPSGEKATWFDTQGQIDFINNTKDKWLSIGNNLTKISEKYPDSKWADDSLYCAAFLYLTMSVDKESTEYRKRSIVSLKKILDKYPEISLEQWTKEKFLKRVIWGGYDTFIQILVPKDVTEKEKLKLLLSYFLVIQLIRDKNHEEAIKIFDQVKDRFPNSGYNHMLQDQLDMAKAPQ